MNYIVAQNLLEDSHYGSALRVIKSNHPRFADGTRFDYGLMGIALAEGYVITVLPSSETIKPEFLL